MGIHRDALESMVWQFAHRGVKSGKSVLHTGGFSALEEAFGALNWKDPHEIGDISGVICDVEGCLEFVSNQGSNWRESGYWCLCYEHGFSKSKQPVMKQRAIEREASRNPETGILPLQSLQFIYADPPPRPEIICLCGSSRFIESFAVLAWEFEKQGYICLGLHYLPPSYTTKVADHIAEAEGVAGQMDELHRRKIDLADKVFVINVNGYIGESTRKEIEYAKAHGKPIEYLEPL